MRSSHGSRPPVSRFWGDSDEGVCFDGSRDEVDGVALLAADLDDA